MVIPIIAVLSACTKQYVKPVADFTFRNETASTFVMATSDTCSLTNQTSNAKYVSWNLGDGRKSSDPNLVLSYDKSGTYKVTLTVTNKEGQNTTVSKSVNIKDRVLRSIDISKVYWEKGTNGWPFTSNADIYLQIQKYSEETMTDGYLCRNCPIIYTSHVIREVKNPTNTGITIPVNEKIIIDKKLIGFAVPVNLNNAYLITLMAKDVNGNMYSLQNNRGGGGNYFGILIEDFAMNKFIVQNGPYSDYKLVCDFE